MRRWRHYKTNRLNIILLYSFRYLNRYNTYNTDRKKNNRVTMVCIEKAETKGIKTKNIEEKNIENKTLGV